MRNVTQPDENLEAAEGNPAAVSSGVENDDAQQDEHTHLTLDMILDGRDLMHALDYDPQIILNSIQKFGQENVVKTVMASAHLHGNPTMIKQKMQDMIDHARVKIETAHTHKIHAAATPVSAPVSIQKIEAPVVVESVETEEVIERVIEETVEAEFIVEEVIAEDNAIETETIEIEETETIEAVVSVPTPVKAVEKTIPAVKTVEKKQSFADTYILPLVKMVAPVISVTVPQKKIVLPALTLTEETVSFVSVIAKKITSEPQIILPVLHTTEPSVETISLPVKQPENDILADLTASIVQNNMMVVPQKPVAEALPALTIVTDKQEPETIVQDIFTAEVAHKITQQIDQDMTRIVAPVLTTTQTVTTPAPLRFVEIASPIALVRETSEMITTVDISVFDVVIPKQNGIEITTSNTEKKPVLLTLTKDVQLTLTDIISSTPAEKPVVEKSARLSISYSAIDPDASERFNEFRQSAIMKLVPQTPVLVEEELQDDYVPQRTVQPNLNASYTDLLDPVSAYMNQYNYAAPQPKLEARVIPLNNTLSLLKNSA